MPLRVVLAANDAPDDPSTWSGSSAGLLAALRAHGTEVVPVAARTRWLARAEQAAAWQRDPERWRQRFHANAARGATGFRGATSRIAARRVGAAGPADAILQIGHWYDLARVRTVATRASYHDANIAVQRGRPDLLIDPGLLSRAMRWEAATARRMDVVLAMSQWLARSFTEDYGVDPARIRVVGMGANVSPPATVPERPNPRPIALFVGRSWERKGGPDLLRAWPIVRAAVPAAELVIVGPQRLREPSLPDGVRFEGFLPRPTGEARLRELFTRASAFVLPSRYEPFGSALLEAMGYGLPCVATTACAMPEIVADGHSGHLVPPAEPDALAGALIALLADPVAGLALGREGRHRLDERFTWPVVARSILHAVTPPPG